MRADLAEFARRGQWRRCLEILQQLIATKNVTGTQAVLQQPTVLRDTLQRTLSDEAQDQYKRTATLLVLCGQVLRAAPAFTDAKADAHSHEQLHRHGTQQQEENDGGRLTSSMHRFDEASFGLSSKKINEVRFSSSQTREWRLLVTLLLENFVSSTSDTEVADEWKSNNATPSVSSSTPLSQDSVVTTEELLNAVDDVCTWAEGICLDVDDSLLSGARGKVKWKRKGVRRNVEQRTNESVSTLRANEGKLHNTDEDSKKSNDQHEPPQENHQERLPFTNTSAARISYRLAAAWRRVTESFSVLFSPQRTAATFSSTLLSRASLKEAGARARFQQALVRLNTKEDGIASAEFVLSTHLTLMGLVQQHRSGKTDGWHESAIQQLSSAFSVLCEEVLSALENAAAEVSRKHDSESIEDDRQKFLLECTVVVASAELTTFEWECRSPRAAFRGTEMERSSATLMKRLSSAERKRHVIRAVRHLSRALSRLRLDKTFHTPTVYSSPASDRGSWLATRIAMLQRNCNAVCGDGVVQYEVYLVHLLVNAAGALGEWCGKDGEMRISRTEVSQVDAAALLITAAPLGFRENTNVSENLLRLLRNALQLPALCKHNVITYAHSTNQRSRHRSVRSLALSPFFASPLTSLRSNISAFVCRVLDGCPARLSYALLTGSLLKDNTAHTTPIALTLVEQENLVSAMRTLSRGFFCYLHDREHTPGVTNKGESSEGTFTPDSTTDNCCQETVLPVGASAGSIPFLTRVLALIDITSTVTFLQKLLSFDDEQSAGPSTTFAVMHPEERRDMQLDPSAVLRQVLASISDLKVRDIVAQELQHHVRAGLPTNLTPRNFKGVQQQVSVTGALVESLLSNPVSSPNTAASCMQNCLQTLTRLTRNDSFGTSHSYKEHRSLYDTVRQWFISSPSLYLRNHAQLLLASAALNNSNNSTKTVPKRLSDASAAQPALINDVPVNTFPNSVALQCVVWFQNELVRLSSHVPRLSENGQQRQQQLQQHRELMQLCSAAAKHIIRLCGLVEYYLDSERPTSAREWPSVTSSLVAAARHNSSNETIETVCSAVYDSVDVTYLCHLALASAHAALFPYPHEPHNATPDKSVHAIPPRNTSLPPSSAFLSSPLVPLLTLRTATSAASQEGPLNVLQLQHGRPLSHTQHEQLVLAMQDFSKNRRIRDATALFYSHERQNRRMSLPEVELYAEVAKRATAPFLVRLLSYVPPPCESAVLANAIVTGAWKSYQRAWRHYTQRSNTDKRYKDRRHHRHAMEHIWYGSLAIALQAMELLPTSTQATLSQSSQYSLLRTLYRLLVAQPQWLAQSNYNEGNMHHDMQLRSRIFMSLLTGAPLVRHRLQQGEWVRRSVRELQQTLDFCEAHEDAETSVQAFLRFVSTHISLKTPNSSSSAGVDAVTVPLLSMDTYVPLLWLSGKHVIAVEAPPEGWTAVLNVDSAASMEQESNSDFLSPPPQPGASTQTPLDEVGVAQQQPEAAEEESCMEQLLRLRAAMEREDEASEVTTTVEVTTNSIDEDVIQLGSAISQRDGQQALTPVKNASYSQRRSRSFRTNCVAAFKSISAVLPNSLRRRIEGDMSLLPLVTVLHDALRWCRLKPRLVLGKSDAADFISGGNYGFDATSMDADTDAEEDAMRSGADVLTRILSSMLHLKSSDLYADSPVCLSVSSPRQNQNSGAASFWLDDSTRTVKSASGVRSLVCVCQLPHEAASWKLVQHSDVFIEFMLRYLGEIHKLERSTLWISPAQQQRAETAMVECLQVVAAAMEAVDGWVAEYKAKMTRERGSSSGAAPTLHSSTPDIASISAGETKLDNAIDVFRVRLRSAPLSLLKQLLDAQELATANATNEETVNMSRQGARDLACVLRRDITMFEKCSPANSLMQQLCGVPSRTLSDTSSRDAKQRALPTPLHVLLGACTQSYFSALAAFIGNVAFSNSASSIAILADAMLSSKRLSYILRCITANSAVAIDWQPGNSHGSGDAPALLARVAAVDVTIHRLSSRLEHISLTIEAEAPSRLNEDGIEQQRHRGTAHEETLTQLPMLLLKGIAHDFGQAALLLDECTAWWNALHVESSVDHPYLSRISGRNSLTSTDAEAVNCSLTYHSCLKHIRQETSRLRDVLMDLYATLWWGEILPRMERSFPECISHFWSDEEIRFHHMYLSLVLHHDHHRRDGMTASEVHRLGAEHLAEKLQHALARYPPSTFVARENTMAQQTRPVVDIEALLNDDNGNEMREMHRNANRERSVEGALLAFLVQRSSQQNVATTQRTWKACNFTKVKAKDFEKTFQTALLCLSWRYTSLLWRTVPFFLNSEGGDVAIENALPSTPVVAETEAAQQGISTVQVESTAGLTYTLPLPLWELLSDLAQQTAVLTKEKGNDEGAFHEESVLSLALLSPTPLLVDGYLMHPLLLRGFLPSNSAAASEKEAWLKRLITYSMDETDEGGMPSVPPVGTFLEFSHRPSETYSRYAFDASYASVTLATSALAGTIASKSTLSSKAGGTHRASASLLPTSPCRHVASSLVLAVLRDASLPLEVSPPLSPSLSPPTSAVSRETLLLNLVNFLGYIAPQAWCVALKWIRGTPYPTTLCSDVHKGRRSDATASSPSGAAPDMSTRNSLDLVETCTLRRLRAAFLACGPWPAEIAQPLLEFVLDRQRCFSKTANKDAAANDGVKTDALTVFPEAEELYRLSCSSSTTKPNDNATACQRCVTAREFAYHPLFTPVMRHYVEETAPKGMEDGKRDFDTPVTYFACNGGCLYDAELHAAVSRQTRFRVASFASPLLPSPSPPSSSNTRIDKATLSALQLVSHTSIGLARSEMPLFLRSLLWQLSAAPSVDACMRLVQNSQWKEEVLTLPRRLLAPLLQLAWKTLLIRKVELDTAANDLTGIQSHFIRTSERSTYNTAKSPTLETSRSQSRGDMLGFTEEANAWLEMCAAFFVVTSRAAACLTMTPLLHRARAAKMRRATNQLSALTKEISCCWASVLLDHVFTHSLNSLLEENDLPRSASSVNTEVVEAQFNALVTVYCGADVPSTIARAGSLLEHLRHAYWTRKGTNSASTDIITDSPHDEVSQINGDAGMEQERVLANAQRELRQAVQQLLKRETAVLETHRTREVRWLLWPPAAWELWRFLQHNPVENTIVEKSQDTSILLPLRNPLLVVSVMRAWQRGRFDERGRRQLASDSASLLSVYTNIVFTTLSRKIFKTPTFKERPHMTSRGIESCSLMQLWSYIDGYVHKGRMILGTADSEQTGSGAIVEGSGVVMEAFLQLLSHEDTRIRCQEYIQSTMKPGSSATKELLTCKAVLRCLRPQLLGDAESDATTLDPLQCPLCATTPWNAYLPQPRIHGELSNLMTHPRDTRVTPWHTYLHVLRLCTDGLLDQVSKRRGRRATPSAAAMACVAQKLNTLCQFQQELESIRSVYRDAAVDLVRGAPPILSVEDSQRILCWQLRQLQQIQTHVNALGWTVEQQQQFQHAKRHLLTSVSCAASLVHSDQNASVRKQQPLSQFADHNAVEAATAACFYPHLAMLLPTTPHKETKERQTRGRREHAIPPVAVGDGIKREEVLTTFAENKSEAATARTPMLPSQTTASSTLFRDELSATAVLASIRQILQGPTSNESPVDAEHLKTPSPPFSAQLQRDYTVLHAYLAAALGGVAQRRQNSDPKLLFDFISGTEAKRVLDELKCSQDDVVDAFTRVLVHLVYLLSSPSLMLTTNERDSVIKGGLRLFVAFQPWLPLCVNGFPRSLHQLTDLSLEFVLWALEAVTATVRNKQEVTPLAASDADVAQLVSCVLDGLVHRRQAQPLSSCGVALLGVIHQRLEHVKNMNSYSEIAEPYHDSSRAHPLVHTTVRVDRELLWRLLHTLSALGEREAAEVHQAWLSYSSRMSTRGGRDSSTEAAVKSQGKQQVSTKAAPCSEQVISEASFCTAIVKGLYRDTIKALCGDGGVGTAKMNADFFSTAVRLRTWWATNDGALHGTELGGLGEMARRCVLEDLLCLQCLQHTNRDDGGAAKGSGGNRKSTAILRRATRRACTELYEKYLTIRRTCVRSCDFSGADDLRPAAVLALQLSIAALLLPSTDVSKSEKDQSNRARSVNDISEEHLVELLNATSIIGQTLLKASVGVPSTNRNNGDEIPLLAIRVDTHADIQDIAAHLLQSMSQNLRQMDTVKAATKSSDFFLLPLLSRWETIMTALRALRIAGALSVARSKIQLISTPFGLQCRLAESSTNVKLNGTRICLSPSLAPTLYLAVRNLLHADQLLHVPLQVLLHELLLPLLVLETKATHLTEDSNNVCRQVKNRLSLLRDVAHQLAAHSSLFNGSTAPPFSKLTPAIETAARTTVTASDASTPVGPDTFPSHHSTGSSKTSTAAPTAVDLGGWPAALVFLKVVARLEALLVRRIAAYEKKTEVAAFYDQSSIDVSTGAAQTFASHYASFLAQRGSSLVDYLAFALVARHYTSLWEGTKTSGRTKGTSSLPTTREDDNGTIGVHRALDVVNMAQLSHAITVTAPPSSVGALIALFRRHATRSELWPRARGDDEKTLGDDRMMNAAASKSPEEERTAVSVVIPAVTESEVQELKRLSLLLGAST